MAVSTQSENDGSTMSGERFHCLGRFVIRTERIGRTLLYDVLTKSGLLVALGFDMLSGDEETALEGITSRLYGKSSVAA
jgi:hypothetical protein